MAGLVVIVGSLGEVKLGLTGFLEAFFDPV